VCSSDLLLSISVIVIAYNIQFLGINTAILILFLLGIIMPLLINKGAFSMKKENKKPTDSELSSPQINSKTVIAEGAKFIEINN
jgi:hypothetical protein